MLNEKKQTPTDNVSFGVRIVGGEKAKSGREREKERDRVWGCGNNKSANNRYFGASNRRSEATIIVLIRVISIY
jgi:hypothetical protein